MSDKRIWAPWRIGYVSGKEVSLTEADTSLTEADTSFTEADTSFTEADKEEAGAGGELAASTNPSEPTEWLPDAEPACFLCRGAAHYACENPTHQQAIWQQHLILWRGEHVYSILNRYPYTNGHLLVAPLRHVAELHELTDQEHLEAMHVLGRFTKRLRQLLSADGFNIGLNLGASAGAGVPGHLHWHLVPRWQGDHNFMPTLAGTRVIPQSLAAVWEALVETP